MSKATKIVDEIVNKVQDYEQSQSSFLSKVGEWGDLFRVKRPARRDNAYSNPRLTEFFRAGNTLATMMYRMQTSQDPYFEVAPMMVGMGSDQLLKIQSVMDTQLLVSKFKQNLLVADMGAVCFGTTVVQEDYEVIGVNSFGRRLPVTTFKPRSLLQVAFERGSSDIETADWLTTSDLISDAGLMRLAATADDLGQPWNKKVLEHAANEKVKGEDLNRYVLNKLSSLGYLTDGKVPSRKEILMYYGKLETLNDGVEYICALVNRKHLVRFHPNKNQHGKRNFRVGYWVQDPLTLDSRGLGLGGLLGDLHRSMDANRQKVQDKITMHTYNMWARLRSAGIDDGDLKIRPLQIVDMDSPNGLAPLPMDSSGIESGLKLEELLRQEFMSASGATQTLQATVTDATASEVALTQNEAVRNISVKAELVSEGLIREHLTVMHSNNVEFINEPINVNVGGNPMIVYPADLQADVDFKLKMTTDKDYKPKRLEGLQNLLATLVSTKSMHPDLQSLSIVPIVEEIARGLGVQVESLKQPGQDPAAQLMAALMGGAGGGGAIPTPEPSPASGQASIATPVGEVPGSVNA